jgi:hypothetical protein
VLGGCDHQRASWTSEGVVTAASSCRAEPAYFEGRPVVEGGLSLRECLGWRNDARHCVTKSLLAQKRCNFLRPSGLCLPGGTSERTG